MPTINGKSGAYEQPVRYGYDEAGYYTIRTWVGTRSDIASQYSTCVSAGAKCEVRQGVGVDTLEAKYSYSYGGSGNTDDPVNTWEFFANEVEKDILETPGLSFDAGEANKIRNWSDPETSPTLTSADAIALWPLWYSGIRAKKTSQPILRHTQTVSDSYTIKASLTNVGNILTNAQIVSQESLPLTVLFNLPTHGTAPTGYTWGWFKHHPTVRVSANDKTQIEQEWEWGLWYTSDGTLYSVAT